MALMVGDEFRVEAGCGSYVDLSHPLSISTRQPRRQCRAARGANGPSAGFTFIELLIVVAMISILTAIAIPAYRDYLLRGKVSESLLFLGDAKSAINEFHSRWGRMPADNREAGLREPESVRGNYVRSLSVHDGVMVALMDLGKDSDQQPIMRTLTFRPWLNKSVSGSPIIWSCAEQDPAAGAAYQAQGSIAANPVEAKWLPSICRG